MQKFLTAEQGVAIIARLMQPDLPQQIDPWQFASQGKQIQGTLALAQMQRLSALLNSAEGIVEVVLHGGIDELNLRILNGKIQATVNLSCQRCLQAVIQPLVSDFVLAVVRSEAELARLPDTYEPLEASGTVSLSELVEDEIILSLPIVALHDYDCAESNYVVKHQKQNEQRKNPFAALESLLGDTKNA